MTDGQLMQAAVRETEKVGAPGETPISCVIAKEGKVIARGYNRRMTDRRTLTHAELSVFRGACKKEGDWRLGNCTLYVTLEPCPMCVSVVVQTQIPRVIYGTFDPKAGCAGSVLNSLGGPCFSRRVSVEVGVLGDTYTVLMRGFFWELHMECKAEQSGKRGLQIIKKQFIDNLTLNLQIAPILLAKAPGVYYT